MNELPLLIAVVVGICIGGFLTLCVVAIAREWWHRDVRREP